MPHDFRCAVCGAPACYGVGFWPFADPMVIGEWWCRAHVPAGFLPHDRAALPPPRVEPGPPPRQGSLL